MAEPNGVPLTEITNVEAEAQAASIATTAHEAAEAFTADRLVAAVILESTARRLITRANDLRSKEVEFALSYRKVEPEKFEAHRTAEIEKRANLKAAEAAIAAADAKLRK